MLGAMPDALLTAIIGGIAGVVGGAISPVITLIQSVRQDSRVERERRRALLKKWRTMLLEVPLMAQDPTTKEINSEHLLAIIEIHPDFQDLRPLLPKGTEGRAWSKVRTMKATGGLLPPIEVYMEGVADVERRWGLQG